MIRLVGTGFTDTLDSVSFAHIVFHEQAKATVRQWMFSWASPQCETAEEYELSKALFLLYLDSEAFLLALGPDDVVNAKTFYREKFEPHEGLFEFYRRRHILHFDTSSNSAHEGTNKGMKYHSAPVRPQHPLVQATKVLCFQGEMKEVDLSNKLAEKENSRKLWSALPTADYLSDLGEALLSNEWMLHQQYSVVGPTGEGKWFCLFCKPSDSTAPPGVVPVFQRVRCIQRCTATGTLRCSCCYFERVGLPCRHIMAILKKHLGNTFKGVSHHDVLVLWHKSYYFHGMQPSNVIRSQFMKLRDNDIQGPVLCELPATVEIDLAHPVIQLHHMPLADRCLNYSSSQCSRAFQCITAAPAHLSQETHFNNDEDSQFDDTDHFDDGCVPSPVRKRPDGENTRVDAYPVLAPMFKELMASLDRNCDFAKLEKYKDTFEQMIACERAEAASKIRKQGLASVPGALRGIISSAVPSNKRRKSHGTIR